MNGQITELYSDADMAGMAGRIKRCKVFCWALALAALAACITMIALTNTANAPRMEGATVAVSTLAGWVVLYVFLFMQTPARRELAHARMLHQEERERVEGAVAVKEERFTIRKSVAVRRVEVTVGDETQRLLVCDSRAGALAAANATVLYACHGYVAAYEVTA